MLKKWSRWRSAILVASLLSTSAFASSFGDVIRVIGGDANQPAWGQPGPGPGHGGPWDRDPGRGWPGRPGPGRPPYPPPGPGYGRGDISCSAADKGWEEHFGGHGSCGECLSKHGGCTETCQETTYRYVVSVDGRDLRGNFQTFLGEGRDQYEAENNAQYACRRSGYADCRYARSDVRRDTNVVSRRDCGRR